MKRTNPLLSFGLSVLVGTTVIYGCGDDDAAPTNTSSSGGTSGVDASSSSGQTGTSGGTSSGMSSGTSGTPDAGDAGPEVDPLMPAIGTQIDRFGRPAVNTALNHPFDSNITAQSTAKDAYNKDGTAAGWSAAYLAEVEKSLAIYDALDTECGNQFLADKTKTDRARYATLASILADDRQWLYTKGTYAASKPLGYLAVELSAGSGVANTEPGGRRLDEDVIDKTYAIASSTYGTASAVDDGVAAVPEKTSGTTFPYLAAP